MGAEEEFHLSDNLVRALQEHNIHILTDAKAQSPQEGGHVGWKQATDLRL